jgi:hypothetical protein
VSSDAAIDSERTTTIPSFQQPTVESQITSEKPIDAQVDESQDKVSSEDSGDAATTVSPLSVEPSSYTPPQQQQRNLLHLPLTMPTLQPRLMMQMSWILPMTQPHQSPQQLMLPLRFPLMIVPPPLQGLLLILPPKLQPSIPSHQSQSWMRLTFHPLMIPQLLQSVSQPLQLQLLPTRAPWIRLESLPSM